LGIVLGLITGLFIVGVEPTFLVAGLGVAGVVLGLALQDSVSNLAAGVFILLNRPYDLDDKVIVGGVHGRVRKLGLASTTVNTFDNRLIHVPNRKIWGDVMENQSSEPTRRAEASVSVTYEDDLDRIHASLLEMLGSMELVLDDPPYEIYADLLGDSGVELKVRAWANNDDWWELQKDLPGRIWAWFQENDIEIPYPRRQIIFPDLVEVLGEEPVAKKPTE
jgi:small conductance mechanosensitive channel